MPSLTGARELCGMSATGVPAARASTFLRVIPKRMLAASSRCTDPMSPPLFAGLDVGYVLELARAVANGFGFDAHTVQQSHIEIGHRRFFFVNDVASGF